MKKWTGNVNIETPIEHAWNYIDGSLEDMKKIMPNVVDNQLVKETEDGIGNVYRQKYKEGKRVQQYDVEILSYDNKPDYKKKKEAFQLGNYFKITTEYEMEKMEDNKTYFRYSTTNEPINWLGKLLTKMGGGGKVVTQFVHRVKNIAEDEYSVDE